MAPILFNIYVSIQLNIISIYFLLINEVTKCFMDWPQKWYGTQHEKMRLIDIYIGIPFYFHVVKSYKYMELSYV